MTTHVTRDGVRVEFSNVASVQLDDGSWFNAFQQNSYVARVTFVDCTEFIVALPDGAASKDASNYVNQVVEAAGLGLSMGSTTIKIQERAQ